MLDAKVIKNKDELSFKVGDVVLISFSSTRIIRPVIGKRLLDLENKPAIILAIKEKWQLSNSFDTSLTESPYFVYELLVGDKKIELHESHIKKHS